LTAIAQKVTILIMLTGLSRPQQMLYFFQQHQEEIYSTNYISQYICNNFDLTGKNPTKNGMLVQINNEVSSNFTKFADSKYKKNPIVNFKVISTGKEFLYQYQHNPKLNLPTPLEIDVPNPYETTILLKPTQTSFNFEQIDEETQHLQTHTEEQNTNENSPLLEDIKAADKISEFYDPINTIIEKFERLNLNLVKEVSFSGMVRDRKFKIIIENF
jgi:hypothetical protein